MADDSDVKDFEVVDGISEDRLCRVVREMELAGAENRHVSREPADVCVGEQYLRTWRCCDGRKYRPV